MSYKKQLKEWAARRVAIANLYRRGKTVREIANVYDLTTERVRVLLKKEGVILKCDRHT